jgi:diacylglycerol kinase family enzyme
LTSADRGILLAAVTVGPSIGGGFFLSPRAHPYDGLLDLFVAESLGIVHVLRYLPGILRGTLEEAPGLYRRQVTRIEIRQLDEKPFPFELDGELMPEETSSIDIEVQARSLRVLELPTPSKT